MIHELEGLRVTVDRVVYVPHLDAQPDKPFPFVYFITIHNDSDKTVTLKGRKWVVTDSQNQTVVVEGEGVVPPANFVFPSWIPAAHRAEARAWVSSLFKGWKKM